ncbi:MAG: type 4a pilus biogenesis protein PilO [Burkholderiales bacterium]
MTLDELRSLNPKDIGNWPFPAKAGALLLLLLLILVAAFFLDWNEKWDSINQGKAEENTLRETFLQKKEQAINLDGYKRQLAETENALAALLKQLPNKSEMDALLIDINQAGLGRGLQFELFKPAAKENVSDFYAELPVNVKVTGNYHDLGAFASDIAKLPRIVLLNDLNIQAGKDSALTMDAIAKTYRYLDEEELSKQRKAVKDAKAPK